LESIEDKENDRSEQYRERWLTAKLSLYGSFLTFSGLTLAASALFAQSSNNAVKYIASAVIFLTMISSPFVFLQYHWLVRLYDKLGFSTACFKSEQDVEIYLKDREENLREFVRRKRTRKIIDKLLYTIAIVQIILLGIASLHF
jgi:hypothetical protein